MYEFPTESPECPKGRTDQQAPIQLAASVNSEPTVPAMIGSNHNEHREKSEESKGAIKVQLAHMGGEVPLDDLSAQQLA